MGIKYSHLQIADIELKNINLSQDEHSGPTWNGVPQIMALDFGWGNFETPENWKDKPLRCSTGPVKILSVYDAPTCADRYISFQFVDDEAYSFLAVHISANNLPQQWQIINAGETICSMGYDDSIAPHLHVDVQKNGEEFSPREFIFNNETTTEPTEPPVEPEKPCKELTVIIENLNITINNQKKELEKKGKAMQSLNAKYLDFIEELDRFKSSVSMSGVKLQNIADTFNKIEKDNKELLKKQTEIGASEAVKTPDTKKLEADLIARKKQIAGLEATNKVLTGTLWQAMSTVPTPQLLKYTLKRVFSIED